MKFLEFPKLLIVVNVNWKEIEPLLLFASFRLEIHSLLNRDNEFPMSIWSNYWSVGRIWPLRMQGRYIGIATFLLWQPSKQSSFSDVLDMPELIHVVV